MADLRAIAEAATPGPWHRHTYGHRSIRQGAGAVLSALLKGVTTDLSYVHADGDDGEGPSVCLTGNGPKQTDNAAHIAAWSPDRAIAALDVIEAAQVWAMADDTADGREQFRLLAALARWEALP